MSQCYAVPPLERRKKPVWQAGLALSGGASRVAARGPNHDTTPAALAAGAGRLAGKGAAKRHGPDRVRQAPRAEGGSLSSGRHRALGSSCELSKVAVHTGDPGFFFYIFMNRWGRNNFVPRPPYWHGRIEIREREMELEPWCDGLGELPSLSWCARPAWSDTSKVEGWGRGEVLLRETLDRQAPGTGQPD